MTGSGDGGADARAPGTAGAMMAGRRGPRADARGYGTARRTGLWHGPTHGAMERADTRGHGTGRHTGPWHDHTHGAGCPGQRARAPLTHHDFDSTPSWRHGYH